MTDIALTYNAAFGEYDISLDGFDLATDAGLATAIILSIEIDGRANPDDPIPPGADPRGWWGDRVEPLARPNSGNGTNPDRIGSRMWTIVNQPQLPSLLPQVKDILAEAVAWLTEDGWASAVDIAVAFPARGRLTYTITATKPDGSTVAVTRTTAWGI